MKLAEFLLADQLEATVWKSGHEDCSLVHTKRRGFFLLRFGELSVSEFARINCGIWIAKEAVATAYSPHVFLCFVIRRDFVTILHYRAFTGVVAGQSEDHVS